MNRLTIHVSLTDMEIITEKHISIFFIFLFDKRVEKKKDVNTVNRNKNICNVYNNMSIQFVHVYSFIIVLGKINGSNNTTYTI